MAAGFFYAKYITIELLTGPYMMARREATCLSPFLHAKVTRTLSPLTLPCRWYTMAGLEIGAVDDMQGQEKKAVELSVIRSNDKGQE